VKNHATSIIREDCLAAIGSHVHQFQDLKNDTVVITGGTGFMGTWLTEFISTLNDEHGFNTKMVLISRSTDHFSATRPHLSNRKDVTLIKSDVRNLVELPKETNWLIHAAANPDNRFHTSNPIDTMSIIADGTSAVLRAVDRCSDFKNMLNISSALVYGQQPLNLEKIPENFTGAPACWTASSAYAEAKRYAETLCASARSQARIGNLTARPFAFIGPYQKINGPWAINNFINDAMTGNAIRVFGDGQTVRSYMYPSDMAFWLLRILISGTTGASYNVGSPHNITLQELAGKVSAQFSSHPEVHLRTAPSQAPVSRLVPDVSLAHGLGLTTTVSLEKAIERTVQWLNLL
jgi:nucleoside-diphosphate-sugar epimerase